jgi:hypothetical protein
MKHLATAFISALLSAGLTVSLMDNAAQEHIDRVRVVEFNAGWEDGYTEAILGN